MRHSVGVRRGVIALAGIACCLMAGRPVTAGARAVKSDRQIQGQERVLHALNRFTFGPRPGEVAAVEQMGLKRWFEQQLNPDWIDDSALDARLVMFPAMKMPQAELMARYPTPQRLRQMIRTGAPLPASPVEHAIYADEIARYQRAKAKQESAPSSNAENAMQSATEPQTDAVPEAARVIDLPPDERMQRIAAMPPEEFFAFRDGLTPRELRAMRVGLSAEQRETLVALQGSNRMIGEEVLQSRLIRDIYSERQLQSVMTDFWLNHFNVYLRKNQNEPYLLPSYERDSIRPHALGKFEDLLVAVARSPAMLVYLDNWQSIGPDSIAATNAAKVAQRARNPQVKKALKDRGLNENYGRELMELHTIGVECEVSADRLVRDLDKACGKGYTQQDVIEVAKTLTGWTIDRPDEGATYRFDERRHEPGSKKVLGKKIHEGGEAEGLEVLHMLATSPATAKFISTRLAVRFVSDTPPPILVGRMAKTFLKSDGDISSVLRTMFDSPEFWSPEVYRAKVKTPIEFVVSAARASGVDVTDAQPLVASLNRLGMPLYGMQTPNGYSWKSDAWVNAGDLVDRMNFALTLSSDRMNGVQTDWSALIKEPEAWMQRASAADSGDLSAAAKEKALEALLLGQPASDHTRETVLQQFRNTTATGRENPGPAALSIGAPARPTAGAKDREAQVMAGLLLGSPEFQRR